MRGQTQVELWVSSVLRVFFVSWGTEIDENGVPGPVRDQVPQKSRKKCEKGFGFHAARIRSGGHLGDFPRLFCRSFFDVFLRRPFFAPGRHLGAQSARKGTEMEPEMMKKEVRRHLPERAKTMAGTVRETYWEVPGGARDRPFFETRHKSLYRRVPRGV